MKRWLKRLVKARVWSFNIPIEGLGEVETLRDVQSKRVDVGDEHQHARQFLSARDDAEFSCLLDGVGSIAAGIGKADNFCFEFCACSRNEEKSALFSGCLTLPNILPPLAAITALVSRSRACPNA